MRIRLTAQAVGQRIATLEEAVENDGSVTRPVGPLEPPARLWYVDLRVEAPGYGLPPVSAYRYQEWWHSGRGEWDLIAYAYDYRFGPAIAGIYGYHWHEMRSIDPSGAPVYHIKCVDPVQPSADPHYRATRMDIWEARDELTRLDASGEWPSCTGLRPLP